MTRHTLRSDPTACLDALLERLNTCRGPFVIVGRAHSGTRMMAAMFLQNEVFMGQRLHEGNLDRQDWYREFVAPLVASRFFPEWDPHRGTPAFERYCRERLNDALNAYLGDADHELAGWGWKFSETLFVMPVIREYFPGARFIHVIRDGRDLILRHDGYFQLTAPSTRRPLARRVRRLLGRSRRRHFKADDFLRNVTFGDPGLAHWRGLDLGDRDPLRRNRFLIQMQSWRTCVETARGYGRDLGDQYLEVRYEAFCNNPVDEAGRIWAFLGMPMEDRTRRWLVDQVHPRSIGKWRTHGMGGADLADYERACELGIPLLRELGYA